VVFRPTPRVGPQGGDDRVQTEPPDQEAVEESGEDGDNERSQGRRKNPRVIAVGLMRDDDDHKRHGAGDRQVYPALHDHQGLAERHDRQDGSEWQHAEHGALVEAARCEEHPGEHEQHERDDDGDQAARQRQRGALDAGVRGRTGHAASSVGGSCWSAAVHQLLGRTVQRPVVVHKGYTQRKCGQ
jgi:hypothetical protein